MDEPPAKRPRPNGQFRAPKILGGPREPGAEAAAPPREVYYPPPRVAAPTPEPVAQRPALKIRRVEPAAAALDADGNPIEVEEKPKAASTASISVAEDGAPPEPAKDDEEEEEEQPTEPVVKRLPVSELGRIYFEATLEGKREQMLEKAREKAEKERERLEKEKKGRGKKKVEPIPEPEEDDLRYLVIVAITNNMCTVFDFKGRTSGKPKAIRTEEQQALKVGECLKLGPGRVFTLTSVVAEEDYLSGRAFLTPPVQPKRKQSAAVAATVTAAAPQKKGIIIPAGFAKPIFRRKFVPGTGLQVRKAGDPKAEKKAAAPSEPKALFDDSAPDAVVLFKGEYKPYISVVVDPILSQKLRPHQKIGVKFMFDCIMGDRVPGFHGCILADDMGLGKSIQAITILWTLLRQGKYGKPHCQKAVIVAPSSLVANWCKELDKWLGGQVKSAAIAESTPKGDKILTRFEMDCDVLVISYDQLRKYVDRLAKVQSIQLMICDEGHRLKNAEIKTTKAVTALPTRNRIILSGTPIQNDLTEFHAMVNFVNPGIVGDPVVFRHVFEGPILAGREPQSDEDQFLGAERAHYLSKLTGKFILRRTSVINEKYLPAKVELTLFCRLTPVQLAIYRAITRNVSDAALSAADGSKAAALATITTLKKLTNHPDLIYATVRDNKDGYPNVLQEFPAAYRPGSVDPGLSGKMGVLDALITAMRRVRHPSGIIDKMVVVSNYTQTLDVIANLCKHRGWGYFQLDGNTPIKRRQQLVDLFNVPNSREIVFLLSSKAGGVGLNLIGGNRLVLFDPDWNPANDAQAMARVWREGQRKKVFIYRLLTTGSIEEKIYQRQVNKQGLSTQVVDANDDAKQHFSKAELQALFQLKEDTQCDTHDLLRCRTCAPAGTKGGGAVDKLRQGFSVRAVGPRVDELKSWMHFASTADVHVDPLLKDSGLDQVTFIFANERDAQKISQDIQEERQFAKDEGAIHVDTEKADCEEESGVALSESSEEDEDEDDDDEDD